MYICKVTITKCSFEDKTKFTKRAWRRIYIFYFQLKLHFSKIKIYLILSIWRMKNPGYHSPKEENYRYSIFSATRIQFWLRNGRHKGKSLIHILATHEVHFPVPASKEFSVPYQTSAWQIKITTYKQIN